MGPGSVAQKLADGCVDVLPDKGVESVLARARERGTPLRVKLGVDPTSADLHLGHCVVLQKLRDFQDAGHTAVLIIGDYTARIGDPSGRDKTRPVLSGDEIQANAETYREQAMKILDAERTEIRFNGEWLGALSTEEMFRLVREVTVAQILQRDDFSRRHAAGQPISVLELLYPIMQAYDSVVVEADVELGGTDQLYNLLLGRELQAAHDQPQQLVMTLPLLVGTDGVDKMGKSLGNFVGVTEPPEEIFGKVMSIPDELIPDWFQYASGLEADAIGGAIAKLKDGWHPGEAKRMLARSVVERFHPAGSGAGAEEHFDTVFRERAVPDDIPEVRLDDVATNDAGAVFLPKLLVDHMGIASNGEARRLIQQGGVRLDGEPVAADALEIDPGALQGVVVKAGKRRFLRIT